MMNSLPAAIFYCHNIAPKVQVYETISLTLRYCQSPAIQLIPTAAFYFYFFLN